MHDAGEADGEAQDSAPELNKDWNCWFAVVPASTALNGTPAIIPNPKLLVKKPDWTKFANGGFPDKNNVLTPAVALLRIPKPARRTVFGKISYATAARGCH